MNQRMMWTALALSASAFALGGAAFGVTQAALVWLAPLPLLVVTRRLTPWRAWLAAWSVLGTSTTVGWWGVMPVSAWEHVATMVGGAALGAAAFAWDRAWIARHPGGLGIVGLPVLMMALDALDARLHPFASWSSMAYQGLATPLVLPALLPLGGLSLVVGWLFLAHSALAHALRAEGTQARAARRRLAWAALALWGALGVGQLLAQRQLLADAPTLSVGALANSTARAQQQREALLLAVKTPSAEALEALRRAGEQAAHDLLGAAAQAHARGAQLVLWPEGGVITTQDAQDELEQDLRRWSDATGVAMLVGVALVDLARAKPLRNEAWWVAPGQPRATFSKQRLVPGFEATHTRPSPMTQPAQVRLGPHTMAAIICFEADDPEHVRRAAQGAQLLLVLANDWAAIDPWHGLMASARSMELGLAMVRAADGARSEAFDRRGQSMARSTPAPYAPSVMMVDSPLGASRSPYARGGSWLGVAACAAAACMTLSMALSAARGAVVRRRQRR